ncbi:MAG: HlyD family efflux transporter periplasmic adaptor subunit [Xanthomonadales bacterium]|nr:HlyD family efflux transporter periplasmic adaptor subunit [Xanthomonadales bacterium]MDH3941214.1 HlyD family efflux transporter periplasmic adaptor subunit [Xanthomonadales bacterium]MDH4001533.1 HlyD family efflux transporter periplasmic adaptor subunit [Xanthomonadales bacterium]
MSRLFIMFMLFVAADAARGQQWLPVEPQDRPLTVNASGIVNSSDAQRFGPPPSQSWRITITELAREGSRVKAGDVLAQFDGSATDDRVRTLGAELNARRSELESLLETQASEIEQEKVRLAEAKSIAEKATRKADTDAELYASLEYKKLLEEKAIAQDLYRREQQRTDLVVAVREAKRAELEADIRRLESELAGAERELESFTIRAPRDGLVIVGTDRQGQKLDVNDAVNPGIIVVELADETKLEVQAGVPEYAAARIAVGQPVEIDIDATGGSLEGRVSSVASIVRRQSQYSQAMVRDVTVTLPPDAIAGLRPGVSAKLRIVVGTERDALAVPDEVIHYRDGIPGVIVRGDGWRPIRIGRASSGMHIVESGLEPGDEVAM